MSVSVTLNVKGSGEDVPLKLTLEVIHEKKRHHQAASVAHIACRREFAHVGIHHGVACLSLYPLLEQWLSPVIADPFGILPCMKPIQPENFWVVRATIEYEVISPTQHYDENLFAVFTYSCTFIDAMVNQSRTKASVGQPWRELCAVVGAWRARARSEDNKRQNKEQKKDRRLKREVTGEHERSRHRAFGTCAWI